LEANDAVRYGLVNALEAAFRALDTREPLGASFYASLPEASRTLEEGLAVAGQPLPVQQFATGHAHIDVAWLWPLAVTRQKAARTFSNAVRNLERYPLFHFSQSQPQLYEFIRQDQPHLFEQIQQQVKAGRWEVLGGMWLEADCNITGAESLARQFLLGRRYFEKYFGAGTESPVLWLPDAFGFCWSLPQLIREAGLKYFFTIKLSWNQTNRMPYDSFWWQGLDGSKVLAHFSTTPSRGGEWKASTYNAEVDPGQVMDSWRNFQQKELHPNLLMAYGFGDGGGGPTREMIENLEELQHFPAVPQIRSTSVKGFFEAVEREDGTALPTWNNELYLELHRGTYTSQSRNKRANRKAEFALHDAEFLASAVLAVSPNWQYPQDELNQAWQLVCLNQFHDILPGSSIGPVYQESQAQYYKVQNIARKFVKQPLMSSRPNLPKRELMKSGEHGSLTPPDLNGRIWCFTRNACPKVSIWKNIQEKRFPASPLKTVPGWRQVV
jgi:alpha-mannosidase